MSRVGRKGLARFVQLPAGMNFDDALREATSSVQALRGRAQAEIDSSLERLGALLGSEPPSSAQARSGELLERLNVIASVAGIIERPTLGLAAQAFFRLLDDFAHHSVWDREAVAVHYRALRMLNGLPDSAEAEAVLIGLGKVAQRVLAAGRAGARTETTD